MKKFILLLTAIFCVSTQVYAAPIHTYEKVTPISDSITLTEVEEFYSDRNVSYSYIKADLTDENTSLKLLKSNKGVDILDTVKNLASTEADTVVATNADFFSVFSSSKSFSLGVEIKDGELLASPINPSTMATVSYQKNKLLMSYLDFHIMAVAPNGNYNEIRHLNKHTTYYGDILMYTNDFNNGLSPAPGGEVLEVIVEDGKITEFRRNMPPAKIPENGCVLVVSEGVNMFFANNFAVGDEIKFDYYITPDIKEAQTGFGGGTLLVLDGKPVTNYSHSVSGTHPRTAIGTDKDGTTLYLVTVDGRQDKSSGLTMSALSDLLIELGCYTAVNLDGGGSTNMVASTVMNESLHTINSPTENRKVINAVGLTYNSTDNTPSGILMETDKSVSFIGEPINVNAVIHNKNMRPVKGEITLTSDHGNISNGVFTPTSAGKATITARYGKFTTACEVFIVDEISGIETESYMHLDLNTSKELKFSVFDKDGHFVSITNTEPFEITSSNPSVVSVSGNTLTSVADGTAIITIKKDGVESHVSVTSGYSGLKYTSAAPNVYKTPEAKTTSSKTFTIGALYTNTPTLFSGIANEYMTNHLITKQSSALIGNIGAFNSYEDEKALYIHLDTSKGGIRSTDSSQWNNLANALANSSKKNVFILSDNSLFGKSDTENKVLVDYLSKINKNIFVVTGGTRNTYKNIGGVKYFTIGNSYDTALTLAHLKNHACLEFSFGDDITFEWESIF